MKPREATDPRRRDLNQRDRRQAREGRWHRSVPLALAVGIGLCSLEAAAQLPGPGAAECRGSLAEATSLRLDEYVAALGALAGSRGVPQQEKISAFLETSREIRIEWMGIKAQVSKTHPPFEKRIEERVAFLQFFTYTIFYKGQDSEMFDIDFMTIARTYAAIPRGMLQHLASSMKWKGSLAFPEPPIEFQDLETMTDDAALWAGAGQTNLLELREEIDKLCKKTR